MNPLSWRIFHLKTQRQQLITVIVIVLNICVISKCSYGKMYGCKVLIVFKLFNVTFSILAEIDDLEDDICPSEGFFPDPRSCTKFYRCVETFHFYYAYEFNCPQGTVFDPDIKVCNHPYAVRASYRCFIGNIFRPKVKHIIHVLNNDTVLHKFVSSNELNIADE